MLCSLIIRACTTANDDSGSAGLAVRAVTFNTGTSEGMAHDDAPDDGYTQVYAELSDTWYGDGLAWIPAIAATTAWFATTDADVVGFQEIFWSDWCAAIPAEAHADFVCETWAAGDPTVAQTLLGDGWQVACHPGHPDKCLAVRRSFGTLDGCDDDFCLEGLDGSSTDGCGSGARVARGTLTLADGSALTVVNVHGTSGFSSDDEACRVAQVDQVFVDLGDGEPAANGERNLVLGDLNTDPGRFTGTDDSAVRWNDFVGEGQALHWLTQVGPDAPGSYGGLADIDHVASDAATGDCWIAGVTDGHATVQDAVYFDHHPVVCDATLP
jgi:hypothetical protein